MKLEIYSLQQEEVTGASWRPRNYLSKATQQAISLSSSTTSWLPCLRQNVSGLV